MTHSKKTKAVLYKDKCTLYDKCFYDKCTLHDNCFYDKLFMRNVLMRSNFMIQITEPYTPK